MSNAQPTLLVTGASGQLGYRVIELLLEAGTPPSSIIAVTRTPEKIANVAAQDVNVRAGSFDDPASLVRAFTGADRLLLISTHIFGEPRRVQHLNAVKAAQEAGVGHVIYTSLTNPDPSSPVTLAPDHWATEQALRASTLNWTFLRNNIYADGQVDALARAVASGQLVNAVGNGKIGYVTREDCARAAAVVLASNSGEGQVLDITGPEAVSQQELAQIASELSGKQVVYAPISAETYTQALIGAGLPQPVAELIVSFDVAGAQGFLNLTTNTVEELTGRKPTSVRELLSANRAALQPAS